LGRIRGGGSDGIDDSHPRAGYEPHLAIRYNGFARCDSTLDDDLVFYRLTWFDRAAFHCLIGLQNKDELALLPRLNGLGRNHCHVVQRAQGHDYVDKLSRPEGPVGIGEHRFQLDGSGGIVNQVIDE
jgi:hypothetical protein